jgi:uncharacterized membrane protein
MSEAPQQTHTYDLVRVIGFSDAVFAIDITLLILEVKVPHDLGTMSLQRALLNQWPSYLAFATSFFTIGVIWINHHRVFGLIRRVDDVMLGLNLLLLLGVTSVPFPTALLATHLDQPGARIAAVIYSGTFLVIGILFNLLWRHAIRIGHKEHATHPLTKQYAFAPIGYGILLLVALKSATACLLLSALLAAYFALPPHYAVSFGQRQK